MITHKLLVFIVVLPELLCVHPLDKLVEEYHVIHKDDVHHSWSKQPTLLEPVRVVKLLLWKRIVQLHLTRNRDLFHPMAVAMEIDEFGNSRQHPINAHQFYTGHISDDAASRVKLHVTDTGILTASISTRNDVIYIEPASRYLRDAEERMLTYNRSRIIPRDELKHNQKIFCKHKDNIDVMATIDHQLRRKQVKAPSLTDDDNDGNVCLMHLVSDYWFFKVRGGSTIGNTIIYLANLVETADDVFRNTVWEPGLENFGLQVGNITIYTDEGCVSYNQPRSPDGGKWTPTTLLQEFSYNDWRPYCLAHLFTNRNFDNDQLGLAYVASSNPALQGGICSRYSSRLPGGDPSRSGTANVGLSSFAGLYGRQLLQSEAEHIFTHEVGHNWGSNHDLDTLECNPPFGENGGKYIMYPSVLTGDEPNNKKFSNCSKRWIARALRSRPGCFIQRTKSLCGNYRVDPGEECDEGLENFGCAEEPDSCCNDNCTLRHGAVCSDRNHPCCQGCQLVAANSTLCAEENEIDCLESVYCNGVNPNCSVTAVAKPAGTSCIDNGQCLEDEGGNITCQTYCQHMYDMEPCICPSASHDSKECFFCCRNETDGMCRVVSPEVHLPNGKPCEGGICVNGQCDLKSKDLTSRLYDFFQSLSSDTLRTLIRENIVVTVIILTLIPYSIAAIVICCLDRYTKREYGPIVKNAIKFVKLKQRQIRSRESMFDETDHTSLIQ